MVSFSSSRLDIMKSSQLLRDLSNLLDQENDKIKLDVSELDFIDSAVLGVFVRIQDLAKRKNKELSFVNLSSYVKNMFDNSRLGSVLNIETAGPQNA